MDSSRDLAWWRDYFDGAKVSVFDVINRAIDLAVSDFPSQFKVERDGIAQRLFSACLGHSLCSDEAASHDQPSSGEVVANSSVLDGVLGRENHREVSKRVAASDLEKMICDQSKVSNEIFISQAKGGSRPEVERRRPIIRIKFRGKVVSGKATDGDDMEVRKLPEVCNSAMKLEKRGDCRSELLEKEAASNTTRRLLNGGAKLEKRLDTKAKFLEGIVEDKLEGTKRKLREAYDREDLAKKKRKIQLVGFHEAQTLQQKKGPKVLTKGQKQLRKLLKGRSSSRVV